MCASILRQIPPWCSGHAQRSPHLEATLIPQEFRIIHPQIIPSSCSIVLETPPLRGVRWLYGTDWIGYLCKAVIRGPQSREKFYRGRRTIWYQKKVKNVEGFSKVQVYMQCVAWCVLSLKESKVLGLFTRFVSIRGWMPQLMVNNEIS